jgi:2-oxoglutarate ferredoxin oxidoreductase subunit beta
MQQMTRALVAESSREAPAGMKLVYQRPASLRAVATHFCPGCTHGIIHHLIAETIDELDLRERTLCVAPVGCAVFAYEYFNVDGCQAAHGRAPAMATGLKRMRPDRIVFTYQGDGDLAAIGGNEILHAATRGELITILFVNNTVYGMTGGQMAPTTLPGQITTTTQLGRNTPSHGHPMHMVELLATLPGVAYAVRRSLHSVAEIRRTKQAIRTAFQVQIEGLGLSIVEILSTCPVNWGLEPAAALDFVRDQMLPIFPLGDFKNRMA